LKAERLRFPEMTPLVIRPVYAINIEPCSSILTTYSRSHAFLELTVRVLGFIGDHGDF